MAVAWQSCRAWQYRHYELPSLHCWLNSVFNGHQLQCICMLALQHLEYRLLTLQHLGCHEWQVLHTVVGVSGRACARLPV